MRNRIRKWFRDHDIEVEIPKYGFPEFLYRRKDKVGRWTIFWVAFMAAIGGSVIFPALDSLYVHWGWNSEGELLISPKVCILGIVGGTIFLFSAAFMIPFWERKKRQ